MKLTNGNMLHFDDSQKKVLKKKNKSTTECMNSSNHTIFQEILMKENSARQKNVKQSLEPVHYSSFLYLHIVHLFRRKDQRKEQKKIDLTLKSIFLRKIRKMTSNKEIFSRSPESEEPSKVSNPCNLVFYSSIQAKRSEKKEKRSDMTTSEHVPHHCCSIWRQLSDSGLRAIKSLLVYFLKCRQRRSYISSLGRTEWHKVRLPDQKPAKNLIQNKVKLQDN